MAREWRCKVSSREKLGVAQQAWITFAQSVREIPGVVRVQRLEVDVAVRQDEILLGSNAAEGVDHVGG